VTKLLVTVDRINTAVEDATVKGYVRGVEAAIRRVEIDLNMLNTSEDDWLYDMPARIRRALRVSPVSEPPGARSEEETDGGR
jgi:hypothetical protein